MSMWRVILAGLAVLGATPGAAQDKVAPGLLDTGFVVTNDAFAVKCNSNTAACVSPGKDAPAISPPEGYAFLVADVAKRADAWLTSLGFPSTQIERLDGRHLIRLDTSAIEDAAGYVTHHKNGIKELTLPLGNAKKVFSETTAAPTRDNVFLELGDETRERLGDLAYDINRFYFGHRAGGTIAHELLHTRIDPPPDMRWLDEAMSRAVGNAWNIKHGFPKKHVHAMRLDKPFNDNSLDARGFSYGYAKSHFLLTVGLKAGSPDWVGYLSKFGKMTDPDMGGMDYLYDKMPPGLAFPEAFPRYLAIMNIVVPRGASPPFKWSSLKAPDPTWRQFETEQDLLFTKIAMPKIRQRASFSNHKDIRSSVSPFAADPTLLNRTTLEFDSGLPEHDRLMLARISIEYAPQPDHLRLIFEHRRIDELKHSYLTLADGEFDAGYVRVANVPPTPDDAMGFGYVLRVGFEPVDIEIPSCIEVGEEAEIDLVGFTEEEADNLYFLASANADLDGKKITALTPGPLTVTAVIESHKTRPPNNSDDPGKYAWPAREVELAPSRIAPKGGCSCNAKDLLAIANPRMMAAMDQISRAFGDEDTPSEMIAALAPSLMGTELPEGHSTGYMSMVAGPRSMRGEVCADPLTTRESGETTILSLYTPSVPTLMGGFDGFAVAHAGWGGWPPNSTAALHLEMPVAPQDLETGRTYPAKLAGLQRAGWFPMFAAYDGTFHDFIPYQEAFTGQSETVFPQKVAGTVTVTEVTDGQIEGHFLVAGTGLHHDIRHWLRAGTEDTFEREGTETGVAVRASGEFAISIPDRSTRVLRAGQFFPTAERGD